MTNGNHEPCMFYTLNAPIGVWHTSTATDMPCMFDDAGTFNQNIDLWQTGSVAD